MPPIILRAPDGEVGWLIIELQGTIEPRNPTDTLANMKIGELRRDPVVRDKGLAHGPLAPPRPLGR